MQQQENCAVVYSENKLWLSIGLVSMVLSIACSPHHLLTTKKKATQNNDISTSHCSVSSKRANYKWWTSKHALSPQMPLNKKKNQNKRKKRHPHSKAICSRCSPTQTISKIVLYGSNECKILDEKKKEYSCRLGFISYQQKYHGRDCQLHISWYILSVIFFPSTRRALQFFNWTQQIIDWLP